MQRETISTALKVMGWAIVGGAVVLFVIALGFGAAAQSGVEGNAERMFGPLLADLAYVAGLVALGLGAAILVVARTLARRGH